MPQETTNPLLTAFQAAIEIGNLDQVNQLLESEEVLIHLAQIAHNVLCCAIKNGHINIVQRLLQYEAIRNVLNTADYLTAWIIWHEAGREENTDIAHLLLNFPLILKQAWLHNQEYPSNPLITWLKEFFKECDAPHTTFLVHTKQKANFYFVLADLCMFPEREDPPMPTHIKSIPRRLMELPIMQTILHLPLFRGIRSNHLLKAAIESQRHDVIEYLRTLPNVVMQERLDSNGQNMNDLNLRDLARNQESSLRSLSPKEKEQLAALEKHYEHQTLSFDAVKASLAERYQRAPALVIINHRSVALPLSWDELVILWKDWSKKDKEAALKAYYQHKVHTCYRFLSEPNPWIAPPSEAHYTHNGGARIEAYKPLICLLWTAAIDTNMLPDEDYTVETRIENLIHDWGLIGRAHNWDKTVIRDGERIQVDDLEADNPSCFSGMNSRFFQSLRGHPIFSSFTLEDHINEEIYSKIRQNMRQKLEALHTQDLEHMVHAIIEYTGEVTESLSALDVDKATQNDWQAILEQKYQVHGDKARTLISSAFLRAFPTDIPHIVAHTSTDANLRQLHLHVLHQRPDSLNYSLIHTPLIELFQRPHLLEQIEEQGLAVVFSQRCERCTSIEAKTLAELLKPLPPQQRLHPWFLLFSKTLKRKMYDLLGETETIISYDDLPDEDPWLYWQEWAEHCNKSYTENDKETKEAHCRLFYDLKKALQEFAQPFQSDDTVLLSFYHQAMRLIFCTVDAQPTIDIEFKENLYQGIMDFAKAHYREHYKEDNKKSTGKIINALKILADILLCVLFPLMLVKYYCTKQPFFFFGHSHKEQPNKGKEAEQQLKTVLDASPLYEGHLAPV